MSTLFDSLRPAFFDAIGVAGFGLYVLNYTLLTFQRVRSESIFYFAVNGIAAAMVLVGLSVSFNLAAAMIQIFWIGISAIAIFIRLRRPAQADDPFSDATKPVSRSRPDHARSGGRIGRHNAQNPVPGAMSARCQARPYSRWNRPSLANR